MNSFPRQYNESNSKFTLTDIICALTKVSQNTQWGKELKFLQDQYFEKIVLADYIKKDSIIEPKFFYEVIPCSCLASEIMCKVFHAKIRGGPVRKNNVEDVINYMALHQIENKLYPPILNGSVFSGKTDSLMIKS